MFESISSDVAPTASALSPLQHLQGAGALLNTDPQRTVERFPFTVRVVNNAQDLQKAVAIRHSAYARHVPDFAKTLQTPEQADYEEGAVVLLAESKLDGSPLGTMRLQTNAHKPLSVEQAVAMPDWLQGQTLIEATRLGITEDRVGRVIKTVLFKVFYQYCLMHTVDWMVIAGRSPIDRQYERLLFQDVFPELGYIPLSYANNMPHRVMAFHVASAQKRWTEAKHPLLDFMCFTDHPDIDLGPPPAIVPQAKTWPDVGMPLAASHMTN